jgi:hypothetical protein
MAVSAHRNLNDLLMSWPANVYTPWNAVRWLGDANDRIPGVDSFRMSESLYRPTMISSNVNGCGFLLARLWLKMGSVYAASCSHSCLFMSILTRKTKCTATRILSLSNASKSRAKCDDYKHEAVIAGIATVWAVCYAHMHGGEFRRIRQASNLGIDSAQTPRCCQA